MANPLKIIENACFLKVFKIFIPFGLNLISYQINLKRFLGDFW